MKKWRGWISVYCQFPRSIAAVCHNSNKRLAIRFHVCCGLPTPALRPIMNPAGGSGLWHSALKFRPLAIAIRGTAIFSVAIRLENTAICQYSVTNLSSEFSNILKSSPRHFTSRGPLFELSYIFLKRYFTSLKLIRGAFFWHRLYTNGLSLYTVS
jgi:hypothetical protein